MIRNSVPYSAFGPTVPAFIEKQSKISHPSLRALARQQTQNVKFFWNNQNSNLKSKNNQAPERALPRYPIDI